ncbi:major facilitator superfamily transporter [Colletotrichum abscissum]|uniref:Major facilitator superfamily transporter n=1 Tax=Colletotrichum abscissum TaxID=1671311 RepID=A0A9Q0B5R7_9PEZI|nr:major facilitator superfamily transporter [Colletotrichum abscissum]KAI3558105.1 major facilitator superfamily transporter [Colletotrichum abscissum]KAK1482928.1 major facilitator superfamily transporter [Colletotrichum abscissum]
MLEKRNSVERSRGDTDASNKDMGSTPTGAGAGATAGPGEAVAAAAAEEKEASVPQEVIRNSAANSVRDGGFGGDDDEKRVSTGGGNETRSPSPSPSNSDCESHRDGGEKSGRKGVVGATVWFLTWTPSKLRYDPKNPPQFTLGLNFLFAVAATFTVANLYYNQPVLNRIAETFNVSFERASSVATLMQAGYAAGLLFICPLGDMLRRRPFILGLIWVTAMLWLGLCLTNSFQAFLGLSFIVGATTVTPQLMLPLVADMAPPERKASSLSITTSGLMLGMLIARLLSGIVANYTSWRNIYWFSFGAQNLLLVLLFFFVPDYPSTNPDGLNYFRALWTIVTMLFTEPILVQACLIGFFISSIFTSFWTTLTFLLASPPYEYPSITIGLFSLIGIAAICGGPVYGRLIMDRYVPWLSSVLGQTVILIGCIIGAFTGTFTVAGPVIQAICIDMGIQTAQTANRTAIYTINPKARNRVNTAYMVCVFCGQLTGTAVGNRLYAQGGWKYSAGTSIGFIGLSLIITMLKGPREKSWIGWRGGFKLRKDAPKPQPASPEESQGPVQEPVEKRTDIGAGGEGNRR